VVTFMAQSVATSLAMQASRPESRLASLERDLDQALGLDDRQTPPEVGRLILNCSVRADSGGKESPLAMSPRDDQPTQLPSHDPSGLGYTNLVLARLLNGHGPPSHSADRDGGHGSVKGLKAEPLRRADEPRRLTGCGADTTRSRDHGLGSGRTTTFGRTDQAKVALVGSRPLAAAADGVAQPKARRCDHATQPVTATGPGHPGR
jgi:hypothetical protein